jgi:hypothetical protein
MTPQGLSGEQANAFIEMFKSNYPALHQQLNFGAVQ